MGQKPCLRPFWQCLGCGSCVLPPGSFFGCILCGSRYEAPYSTIWFFQEDFLCSVQRGLWLDGRFVLLADLHTRSSGVSRRTQCLNSPRNKSTLHSRAAPRQTFGSFRVMGISHLSTDSHSFLDVCNHRHSAFIILQINRSFLRVICENLHEEVASTNLWQ